MFKKNSQLLKRLFVLLFAGILLAVPVSTALADHVNSGTWTWEEDGIMTARLTGRAEVPGPGDRNGFGWSFFMTRPEMGRFCYLIVAYNIELPSTGAHIHEGQEDEAGPVVVPLANVSNNNIILECVSVDEELAREILTHPDEYYVNVHTSEFPDGAIRGQLKAW